MPRVKRKRAIMESDSESKGSLLVARRSSLRVNLSFTSRLSDSEDGSSRKGAGESDLEEQNEDSSRAITTQKHKSIASDDTAMSTSLANATVISVADGKVHNKKPSKCRKNPILSIKEKDQQLDKSCTELKNAIMSKTQVLLDNELRDKTSKVLTGCSINIERMDNENGENTTPRVRINIGKNEQILMAGCGEKLHPVQINSMSKSFKENNNINSSQGSDHNNCDCSQSIASTPKKSNIETTVDKSTGKTSKQVINIPVARLFADNDPNNSMSQSNPVPAAEILKSPVSMGNNSNISRICNNELSSTTSPILSQGLRKNRISRLSLKRRSATTENRSSRVSNESFLNRPPLTCSSFIEGPDKTCNKSQMDQHTKTIIVEDKSESSANQKTINLDDNENDTNTINIDHSSNISSMEITTISARTPIVRKPFQQVIQESFKFDTADIPGTQKSGIPNRQSINKSSSKKARKSNSDDCIDNTVKTCLNVNTSLDDVSLAERVTHKENRKPSTAKQLLAQTSKNNTARENQTLTTMRSSLRVNTSLDSVRKSSDSSKADFEPEKRTSVPSNSNSNNQEKRDSTETRPQRPSNGTVRSSMQVNTSLDSVKKSPNEQEPLNYQKILSMVQEASVDNSQTLNLQCQSSEDDSEKESVPLAERIQNISASKNKQTSNEEDCLEGEKLEAGKGDGNLERKSNEPEPSCPSLEKFKGSDKNKTESLQKGDSESHDTIVESDKSKRRKSARKSNANSTNESSVVEATPFPASRSLLFKTIIKNNIATNTLNPRKLVDSSDDEEIVEAHLTLSKNTNSSSKKQNSALPRQDAVGENSSDTIVLDTSDESANESNKKKEKVVIDESMNDSGNQKKSKIKRRRKLTKQRESKSSDSSDEEEAKKKMMIKRKLYPLRENSQISFSPAEMTQAQPETAPKDVKRKKKRKMLQKKQENIKVASPEPDEEFDHAENEISIPKPEKKKKKPRKIKSKKIVVKKVTNLTLLTNIMENDNGEPPAPSTSRRSSLRDFDLRRIGNDASKEMKSHKIVVVMTGHDKDDRDLVKNVVKTLGYAILQANVTPRTTHVISSGVRTINLLKGIIRGCWLLTLEWALKSLENGKWLDPSPYEMSHFSKAVQINRRDRHIFGKAYVPELFITCGPVYIENGTSPPASALKELVKTAGGRLTEDVNTAKVVVGSEGLKENWILDSITTGEIQPFEQYKRN